MTEQDKVTVDDIIGIVKTEEQTNSVEEVRKLRGRGNETAKRFPRFVQSWNRQDGAYVFDRQEPKQYHMIWECMDIMNELHEENEQLKKALWCIRKRYGYTVEEFIEDFKDNGIDLTKVDLK